MYFGKKGISQKNLADGLLSIAELSRIESGNRDEDSFVLAALFERLGKTIDKFEFLKNTEEYKLLCLRRLTEQELLEGKFRTAAVSLMEYREYSKGSIHEQYDCQMRALNYEEQKA